MKVIDPIISFSTVKHPSEGTIFELEFKKGLKQKVLICNGISIGMVLVYDTPLNLLAKCGSKCDFKHTMSCKKGGFISIRHNDICDLTANILKEVCNGVKVEAKLTP